MKSAGRHPSLRGQTSLHTAVSSRASSFWAETSEQELQLLFAAFSFSFFFFSVSVFDLLTASLKFRVVREDASVTAQQEALDSFRLYVNTADRALLHTLYGETEVVVG